MWKEVLLNYGIFLLELLTIFGIIAVVVMLILESKKHSENGSISITNLSEKYKEQQKSLSGFFLSEEELKHQEKQEKKEAKEKAKAEIWDSQPQADVLTLYFNATDRLPRNQMRTLVGNANSALRSMGGAEKMLSSVYGIAITAMVRAYNLCKKCA